MKLLNDQVQVTQYTWSNFLKTIENGTKLN